VARVQGAVIAHGGTPGAALRSAQVSRYKEKPEITFMPLDSPLQFSPVVDRVAALASGRDLFLVGGAVRDALRGSISHDLDFSVAKEAIAFARRVAAQLGADFYVLDGEFDAARVILTDSSGVREVLDFASFRGDDLEADLAGRDFTINAIAVDLKHSTIMDPMNGASDLLARTIRSCSATAMEDDPIRILRAVRLAAALDLKIEPETRVAMKNAAKSLPRVSAERKRDELFKILDAARAALALRALEILGVFPYLLPELAALKGGEQPTPHVYDMWEHTLGVLQGFEQILGWLAPEADTGAANGIFAGLLSMRLGRFRPQLASHLVEALNADRTLRALLFFAALYHDVGKPLTRSVDEAGRMHFFGHEHEGAAIAEERCRAFHLSSGEIARARTIIEHHMRFFSLVSQWEIEKIPPSRRAIYRFFRDAGVAGVDVVLLGLADMMGTRGPNLTADTWSAAVEVAGALLENYWERPQEAVSPSPLIDGNGLIQELGLTEGPTVGGLLAALREAQAAGEVGTREQALSFGRAWLKGNQA
jgi:putative nucleotidyltransferase with HDIG domain